MTETPMQAGPELDAEIARRVFGLNVWRSATQGLLVMCNHPNTTPDHHSLAVHKSEPYSQEIEAAWRVLERLQERMSDIVFGWNDEAGDWTTDLYTKAEHEGDVVDQYRGHADTMPLAICRAALAALEGRRVSA